MKLQEIDKAILDYEDVMQRFMNNEGLLRRVLQKFMEDESFAHLKEALEQKDVEQAFKEAHTLKGLAANMSMVELAQVASDMTELLRSKEYEAAVEKLPLLEEVYQRIVEIVKNVE